MIKAVFVFFVMLLCGCHHTDLCEDSVTQVGLVTYTCHLDAEGSLQTVSGRTYFVCKCRREVVKP